MPYHRGKGHGLPYFKVQVHDERSLVWKNQRNEAFDDEASARAYQATLGEGVNSRVVRWDANGAHPQDN